MYSSTQSTPTPQKNTTTAAAAAAAAITIREILHHHHRPTHPRAHLCCAAWRACDPDVHHTRGEEGALRDTAPGHLRHRRSHILQQQAQVQPASRWTAVQGDLYIHAHIGTHQ